MAYRGQNFVDWADSISDSILKEKGQNKHRDHFFPALINSMELHVGVEVGVDKGQFSNHLLNNTNMNILYCVVSWIDDFGSNYRPDFFDPNGGNRRQEAEENLSDFIPERCALIQDYSINASQSFEDSSIDFCYIDGDHSLEGIFNDIYTWIHKVRVGGIMAGHDYKDGPKSGMPDYSGNQLDYKIKTVVDNFCQPYGYKLNIVGGRILSWWFIKSE